MLDQTAGSRRSPRPVNVSVSGGRKMDYQRIWSDGDMPTVLRNRESPHANDRGSHRTSRRARRCDREVWLSPVRSNGQGIAGAT